MSKFGLKIIVEGTDIEYHTYDDWGLYIQNTDYIGDPKPITNYLNIPGRDGYLDLSKTYDGHITYSSRPISIELAGFEEKHGWQAIVSRLRNHISGRTCHFIFDNDRSYYWRGRAEINDFSSILSVGTLKIEMPTAEPYKYSTLTSAEPWLWDPFNFETGIITYIGAIVVDGTRTVSIPHGYMPTCPQLVVSNKSSSVFTVTCGGETYELTLGTNKIPAIIVDGDNDTELTFNGSATVEIVYRSGSL